jgi:hypothetical protein
MRQLKEEKTIWHAGTRLQGKSRGVTVEQTVTAVKDDISNSTDFSTSAGGNNVSLPNMLHF